MNIFTYHLVEISISYAVKSLFVNPLDKETPGLVHAEYMTAMKLGANHPMGPLELADFIGLDTCLAVMQVLYDGLADTKYRPCPLLVKYVEAGWLGRKSGKGFYDYSGDQPAPTR